ncbi:MAG: hypothetical protein GY883_06825 [Shimia sp.]|nr:hypothetical protein [Shimia sp.]
MDHTSFFYTAKAANASTDQSDRSQIAILGLLRLMARAEVQEIASSPVANDTQ